MSYYRRKAAVIFIYMLFDNKNQKPIYVGATKNKNTRLYNHRTLLLKNYRNRDHVTLEVLEKTTVIIGPEKEHQWFLYIKSLGYKLLQQDRKNPGSLIRRQYISQKGDKPKKKITIKFIFTNQHKLTA